MLLLLSGCVEPSGICDAAMLSAALSTATSGTAVEVGACELTGAFVVPAGVTLCGLDVGRSRLRGDGTGPAVTVMGAPVGTEWTALRSLTVAATGPIGISMVGSGDARIEDVVVEVTHGRGIVLDGATEVIVENVRLAGSFVATDSLRWNAGASDEAAVATYAILLRDVGSATIRRVTARGFAELAIAGIDSVIEVGRDDATVATPDCATTLENVLGENRMGGIAVFGGELTISETSVGGTVGWGGNGASVFAGGGAILDVRRIAVCDGEGTGIYVTDATADLERTRVEGMTFAGIWAIGSPELRLNDLSLVENQVAGLTTRGVVSLDADRLDVRDTRVGLVFDLDRGERIMAAEGISLFRRDTDADPPLDVSITNTNVVGSELVGLLVDPDVGGGLGGLLLDAITIDAPAAALGAVVQNVVPPAGWDASVTRNGTALTNDAAFSGVVHSVLMPPVRAVLP